jgi:hypothetical protein
MSLRGWIRQWLGVPSQHEYEGLAFEFMDDRRAFRRWEGELSGRIASLERDGTPTENSHLRLTAMEATLKRLHDQVQALGALPMGEITMSEAAQADADRRILADKERRDRSAAELRGLSLTEYYAFVQQREAAKKEQA